MPLTWPHVLATGLHLRMLLDPAFPVRVAGLIHLGHCIELLQPMAETATPSFRCRLEGGEAGPRGESFRLATEAAVDGEIAWRETMDFVAPARREAGSRRGEAAPEGLPAVVAEWHASRSAGRRYASISGDWNPIHLSGWSARLFGLPGPIAHGMWTLARCLGQLDGPPGAGARLEVRFLRPLFLPGTARLHAGPAPASEGTDFWLVSLPDESPKLRGRWLAAGGCDEGAVHHDGLTRAMGPPGVP
jgi:acyl dehydratase